MYIVELKPAIDRTISQVLALVSLNPDHLTLSGAVLDQLAAAQSVEAADQEPKPHHIELDLESGPTTADGSGAQNGEAPRRLTSEAFEARTGPKEILTTPPWTRTGPDVKSTDFLENGAAALRESISADAETARKLADALKIFGEMEVKTKELVRAVLQSESA